MIFTIDPTAFEIFGLRVQWYALCILTGVILASVMALREAPRLGINKDHLLDGIIYTVPLAILGARLYYILFSGEIGWYFSHPLRIIGFDGGEFEGIKGLAITGGVITAFIFSYYYTKKKKMNYLATIDLVAPGLLIGQIFGRWGNFFNQEAHGEPVKNVDLFLKLLPNFITDQMNINGIYYHPTFLYEGTWNFIGLILIFILRRKKVFKLGDLGLIYIMWYFTGRGLLIEPFRTDPLAFIGQGDENTFIFNRVNVVLSLIFVIVAAILFYFKRKKLNNEYYYDVLKENVKEEIPFI